MHTLYVGKCGPEHTHSRQLGLTATESQVHEIELREQEVIDFVLAKPADLELSVKTCYLLTVYVYPAEAYERCDDHPLLDEIVRSVVM